MAGWLGQRGRRRRFKALAAGIVRKIGWRAGTTRAPRSGGRIHGGASIALVGRLLNVHGI